MSLFEATGAPERLRFFDGQRLFASDLDGLEGFHREMRRLHLSTLHEPGIAAGFAVAGEEGDRTVRIGPGYAIDDLGREIVLVQERSEQVPPVAGGPEGAPIRFDLTVSYRDDAFLEEAEERQGVCGTRGVVRLREEPVFCWIRLGTDGQPVDDLHKQEILSGRRLTVARAEVLECKLRSRLSIAERFSARPPTQPFIAGGRVEPKWFVKGDLKNVPLTELCEGESGAAEDAGVFMRIALGEGAEGATEGVAFASAQRFVCLVPVPFDIYARIETTCAGFRITPCYWARIEGPRFITVEVERESATKPVVAGYLDAMVRIEEAHPDGFEVHLTPVVTSFSTELFNLNSFEEFLSSPAGCQILEWAVVWKGIEG